MIVKEPRSEWTQLRKNQILFTCLHLSPTRSRPTCS
ncbi:hypothetical protein [Bradyrhizobium retamae]